MEAIVEEVKISDQKKKQRRRTLFALSFGYFIDNGEGQALSVLFPTLIFLIKSHEKPSFFSGPEYGVYGQSLSVLHKTLGSC
ncbi:MAG: hypothetical protein XE06_1382 [Anaerolineaceae bacterium 46_22]|nr:MAG: hypothetical protein XE06_1382 [Anaerolineaceae bacterium 46_22]